MEFNSKGSKIAVKDDGNQGSIFVPEELVIEILLRLHIRPLFRSKLVSKRWNFIISHPKFAHCYLQRASSSSKSSSNWHLWGYCEDRILASSGGLILAGSAGHCPSSRVKLQLMKVLHVINPLTKQSAKLPSSMPCYFNCVFGLATRPVHPASGGDHQPYITYKVVVFEIPWFRRPCPISSGFILMIFSSDTWSWAYTKLTTCPESALRCIESCDHIFSYSGILHIFNWPTRSIVTYDPYDSPDAFGSIQLPSTGSANILQNSEMNVFHFGHEDVIKFGEVEHCDDHGRRLCVWQLVDRAKGEWRLEQRCLIGPLWEDNIFTEELRILVAPDPCNGELFCLFLRCGNILKAIDLGSAKEVFVDPSMSRTIETYSSVDVAHEYHPIALCPWSSPFYGGARSNPSSAEGLIPHVWFP